MDSPLIHVLVGPGPLVRENRWTPRHFARTMSATRARPTCGNSCPWANAFTVRADSPTLVVTQSLPAEAGKGEDSSPQVDHQVIVRRETKLAWDSTTPRLISRQEGLPLRCDLAREPPPPPENFPLGRTGWPQTARFVDPISDRVLHLRADKAPASETTKGHRPHVGIRPTALAVSGPKATLQVVSYQQQRH